MSVAQQRLHRSDRCIGCHRGSGLVCIECNTLNKCPRLDFLLSVSFRKWIDDCRFQEFKTWSFKCFYFYNCFDTDCKIYITYDVMERLNSDSSTDPGGGDGKVAGFFYYYIVSVLHHLFFFVLLLIWGAVSYQCNKILKCGFSISCLFPVFLKTLITVAKVQNLLIIRSQTASQPPMTP